MEDSTNHEGEKQPVFATGARRESRRWRYHQKAYFGLLIFVAVAGIPVIAVPSLRARLRVRVQALRAAALAEPIVQPPAEARVGENREPFPKEYMRAAVIPSYLPKIEAPSHAPFRIVVGGNETAPQPENAVPGAPGKATPQTMGTARAATEETRPAGGAQGTESQYRKGKSEQEAYDLLMSSNQTLAGMIQGKDPALKYQDWGATSMGQDSYYVMVTFVQTDGTVRKYIWNVKLASKEVVALSSYAREISK
jgi:hypothetical protein